MTRLILALADRRVVLLVAFIVVAMTPTTTVVVQAFQQIHVVRLSGSTSSSTITSIALKKANGGGGGSSSSSSSKDGPEHQRNKNRGAAGGGPELKRVSPDVEGIPIPFIDHTGTSFIECYADSVAHVNGVEYTIGVPCDYSVALCYFDATKDNALVPVELDDALMDDIFPIAANIVAEEFDEELVLQRTPQTLTLVGELEDDDDDDEEEEEDDEDEDDENDENDEEDVEVLLTFEHRDKEYHLVRLLDPILLVGKVAPSKDDDSKSSSSLESSPVTENRILLTPEESNDIMPLLENMFLEFHNDDPDNLFA